MTRASLQRYAAEFIGTAFLLSGVVGSGIMASRLSTDPGLILLQNALATGFVLIAVILALGPASGAHLNPAVTAAAWAFRGLPTREAIGYAISQVTGGITGVILTNLMFDIEAISWATTERTGGDLFIAEIVATFGLVLVIFGVVRSGHTSVVAFAVGTYIAAAYYFTSSTSFANPAVTVARMFSDTFAGIDPGSVLPFLGAQALGTLAAVGAIYFIYPSISAAAGEVVVPHEGGDS